MATLHYYIDQFNDVDEERKKKSKLESLGVQRAIVQSLEERLGKQIV